MKKITKQKGFSLFELVVVLGILLIILGIVFSGFTSGLRTFRQERAKAERDSDIKRVLELMSIELGQAGVTPNLLNEDIHITGPKTNGTVNSGATTINFTEHNTGLYPRRPIILELPEDAPNSEKVVVNTVTSTTQITLVSPGTAKTHTGTVAIGSPSFPNMFGILNPPPTTAALTKAIAPTTALVPVRLGFFGDILGNGSIYYVEYTYDYSNRVLNGVSNGFIGRLRRSITPITPVIIGGTFTPLTSTSTKSTATTILDNVTRVEFTLVYPSLTNQIPISVGIEIEGETSAPIASTKKGSYNLNQAASLFNRITARTQVYLRGTGSAANIIDNGGEPSLREMMPPCNTASATALPPCPSWTGVPWWGVVKDNFAGKKFDNSAPQDLP
jgi:prepilin-type N-terminal cleavage/methylation domain-containing protein